MTDTESHAELALARSYPAVRSFLLRESIKRFACQTEDAAGHFLELIDRTNYKFMPGMESWDIMAASL
jgi:hypothetical protein